MFEKTVEGKRKNHTNFFVTLHRSYPNPEKENDYVQTTVLNPQGLLIAADLYRIASEFILEEFNRE